MPEISNRRLAHRHCAAALLVLVAVLPLMLLALLQLNFANDDVRPWFPDDTPERKVIRPECLGEGGTVEPCGVARGREQGRRPDRLSKIGARSGWRTRECGGEKYCCRRA